MIPVTGCQISARSASVHPIFRLGFLLFIKMGIRGTRMKLWQIDSSLFSLVFVCAFRQPDVIIQLTLPVSAHKTLAYVHKILLGDPSTEVVCFTLVFIMVWVSFRQFISGPGGVKSCVYFGVLCTIYDYMSRLKLRLSAFLYASFHICPIRHVVVRSRFPDGNFFPFHVM